MARVRGDAPDGEQPATVPARPTPLARIAPTPDVPAGEPVTRSLEPTESAAAPDRALDADWAERGRYALVEELARGGGGRIAVAIDRKLHRRVALKRPLDRDGGDRLAREALVLARLEHPAIVPIHDVGEDAAGAPFYAMKLLGRQTLGDRMRAAATFDQRVALLAAVTTVADAVAYAHGQHVIHRDLKPSNVLVGDFGEVALIDWGLGKVLGTASDDELTPGSAGPVAADLTGVGGLVGTPAYMAPEQAAGAEVDERADVYALGATLYQVLTGHLPYGDGDAELTLARLRAGPPRPIADVEPRVPDDLAAIVAKAMAREPERRYRTGRELADDLHRYQTGRLVAAHRYRLTTRARRWLWRQRLAIASVASIAAIAVAGVAVTRRDRAAVDPCRDVAAPVALAWNPTVRAAGERAFLASGVPYAIANWNRVASTLDLQAARIGAMRVAACRATRVSGEQSPALMTLRLRCLDQRLDELRGAAEAFSRADPVIVERSPQLLATMGQVDDCADAARLEDLVPLPADPERRTEIAAVQQALPRIAEYEATGKLETARWPLIALTIRALATGYPPLSTRLLNKLASLPGDQDELAVRTLWAVVAAADRAHDDEARGRALGKLIAIEINARQRYPEAEALIQQALAIADRTNNLWNRVDLTIYRSQIAQALGRVDDAVSHGERAVELGNANQTGNRWRARFVLAAAYVVAGRHAEADRLLGTLVEDMVAMFGTDVQPDIGRALQNQAAARHGLKDYQGALALMARARTIFEQTRSRGGRDLLELRANIAMLHNEVGDLTRGHAELVSLLPEAEALLGHDASQTRSIAFNLADNLAKQGHAAEALAGFRDALARAKALAPGTNKVADCHYRIGLLLDEGGQPHAAIAEYEAAAAIHDQLAPGGRDATYDHADLGRNLLAIGEPRRAISELERALATATVLDGPAHGRARSDLARAYWAIGQRARARATAAEARQLLVDLGPDGAELLAELDAWTRAHP